MNDIGDFAYDVVQELKEVDKQMKIQDPKIPVGGVSITLGHHAEFFITQDGGMGIRQQRPGSDPVVIELGYAYERSLNNILLHMGSLRIHTERMK